MKTKKLPPSKFTTALKEVYFENGWVFPPEHTVAIYEQRIRQLEEEIDVLTGGRASKPERINPMEGKQIPS